MNLTPENSPIFTRAAEITFQPATWNPVDRTMDIIISTGSRGVQRDRMTGELFDETLSVEEGAIDTTRVDAGACPFLDNHGERFETMFGPTDPIPTTETTIGRVLEQSIRFEPGRALGRIYLTTADDALPAVQRIVDGTTRGISAGYKPLEWVEMDDGTDGRIHKHVTRWMLFEVSSTGIPMDVGAQTRSAAPGVTMGEATDKTGTSVEDQITAARNDGAAGEAIRLQGILSIAKRSGIDLNAEPNAADPESVVKLRSALTDRTVTVDMAVRHGFDFVASKTEKTPITGTRTEVGMESTDFAIRGIDASLQLRAGVQVSKEDQDMAGAFRADSLLDLGRRCLEMTGVKTGFMSRPQLARSILHQVEGPLIQRAGAHMTGDFPALTANLMGKVLKAERELTGDYSWYKAIGTRVDLPDFKPRTVVDIGGLGELPEVREGAEYQRVTFGEDSVSWFLVKRGAEIAMTEEMILNDDLNGFLRLVRMWVRASIKTDSKVAADAIFLNPVMGDGKAAFTAGAWNWSKNRKVNNGGHANLVTAGGAPTPARIAALDLMNRIQIDRDGGVCGNRSVHFLGASDYVTTLEQLYSDHYKPTTAAEAITVPLLPENRHYIPSLAGTKPWIMATADNMGFEFGGLQGEGGPVVIEYNESRSDSRVYHCRDIFAARLTDPRPFAMDSGVTG